MSGDIVPFPSADRPISDEEVNARHAEAFRDLEARISDCETMALITMGLAHDAIEGTAPKAQKAAFAVAHLAEMLTKLQADYQAAYHGERLCD